MTKSLTDEEFEALKEWREICENVGAPIFPPFIKEKFDCLIEIVESLKIENNEIRVILNVERGRVIEGMKDNSKLKLQQEEVVIENDRLKAKGYWWSGEVDKLLKENAKLKAELNEVIDIRGNV